MAFGFICDGGHESFQVALTHEAEPDVISWEVNFLGSRTCVLPASRNLGMANEVHGPRRRHLVKWPVIAVRIAVLHLWKSVNVCENL
jgi:hypothetical protein